MRGQSTTAGYLIGAYHHMGREDMTKRILEAMVAAGHKINVENPFVLLAMSLCRGFVFGGFWASSER